MHDQLRAAKFRPLLGTYGHGAERDLYRATPSTTRDLDLHGFIRKSASLVASHAKPVVLMTYSYQNPNRIKRTEKIVKACRTYGLSAWKDSESSQLLL